MDRDELRDAVEEAAEAAGDGAPSPAQEIKRRGWRRVGSKEEGFRYENARGEPIKGRAHVERVEGLRIPPAWKDVRISPSARADLQATGFDDAGRKQYLYHPEFVERQAARKFEKLGAFARALPRMRELTSEHLEGTDDPVRVRVMAALVRLINEAYFRVGTEEYAKKHRTYGITTLERRHVKLGGDGAVSFEYVGKKGVRQRQVVVDEVLFEVIEQLLAIPGKRVFKYLDEDGELHFANGHMLNAYIREVMAPGISAKDFRTWAGTLLAAEELADAGPAESERQRKQRMTAAAKRVAEQLGNTPAVARASYISPVVFERYEEGKTLEGYMRRAERTIRSRQLEYEPEEVALMGLLGIRLPRTDPQQEPHPSAAAIDHAVAEQEPPAAG